MKSQEKVPFAVLAEALRTGREIEFSFHSKNYSITNSSGW